MPRARFSPRPARWSGGHHLGVGEPLALPTAIAAAIDDLCRDLERYHVRREQRLHLTDCIASADLLIEDLEGLTLAGAAHPPADWEARLDDLAARLPDGVARRLDGTREPATLLDQLFAIEEDLYRLKLGEWARALDGTA